jgi:hypothetical protein
LKDGIALDDYVYNRADIYFDFNAPVLTNSAFNYYPSTVGITETEPVVLDAFPNPTNGIVTVLIEAKENKNVRVLVRDAFGQVVHKQQQNLSGRKNNIRLNINYLASGLYFIQIGTNGKLTKMIK